MSRLAEKIAVISGGSAGIGLATAARFVEEGAFVYITGRRQEELDKAVAAVGKNIKAIQGDVTKLADVQRIHDVVKADKGALDIIFANAGAGDFAPLGQITEEFYQAGMDLNVKGVLFLAQALLPLIRDNGSIVISGSIASAKGLAGMTVYSAAKAAVRSFARTWTVELKGRGIRTNILSPGPVLTLPLQSAPQEVRDGFAAGVPLGRLAEPHEIASLALFLASDEAAYVTGAEFFADGGFAQV